MDVLREYLFGVITAAMICGLVTSLSERTGGAKMIRFLCGVFMTVTVLTPVGNLDLDALLPPGLPQIHQARQQVMAGRDMAQEACRDGIKQALEAYVWDKAPAGLTSVEIVLSQEQLPVPESILLRGAVSSREEEELKKLLTEDLGIPEEAQQWIG